VPGGTVSASPAITASTALGASAAEAGLPAAPVGSMVGSITAPGVGRSSEPAPPIAPAAAKPKQPETETRVSVGNRSTKAEARAARASGAPKAKATSQPTSAASGGSGSTPAEPAPARANPSATTVAGIGPAALSMMRALETAAAGVTAKIRVAAPRADASRDDGSSDADKFAALPSPLSDLGLASRKTLVGIIPPSLPASAPPLGAAPPGAPPALISTPPAASKAKESLVISGTPCKSIEVSSEADDAELPGMAGLRRPGNPTVPFPRPRAASRGTSRDVLDPGALDSDRTSAAPPSWHERTHHTLRIVLTDPDHRPHLVAGLVVCAAAAVVIFMVGRSPVAGSGALDQATRSLAAEPAAAPPIAAPPRLAEPSVPIPELKAQESLQGDAIEVLPPELGAELAKGSALPGEEVAPGLVLPPRPQTGSPASKPRLDKPKPVTTSPSPLPPTALPRTEPRPTVVERGPTTASASEARLPVPPRAAPTPATGEARPPVPPRAPPRKPGDPAATPRPTNPDFDFGI